MAYASGHLSPRGIFVRFSSMSMKNEYKKTENEHFLSFVDHDIRSLVEKNEAGKLAYLKKRLTEEQHQQIMKLGMLLVLKSLSKNLVVDAWQKAEAKSRKIEYEVVSQEETDAHFQETLSPEQFQDYQANRNRYVIEMTPALSKIWNDYITEPAKQEYATYWDLRKAEGQAKKLLVEFVNSFEHDVFKELLTRATSLIAMYEGNQMVANQWKLLISWQKETRDAIRRTKGKRKGQVVKEILAVTLGPGVNDVGGVAKEDQKDIKRWGVRTSNISVNLDEDLDVSQLTSNGTYQILTGHDIDPQRPNIIEENEQCIFIAGR